jgi:hypothetical protein
VPKIDKEERSAYRMVQKFSDWLKTEIRNLNLDKADASFRLATRTLRQNLAEIVSRTDVAEHGARSNSTTPNERAHEISSVRYLARPIVQKMIELASAYPEICGGSKVDFEHGDASEIADGITQSIKSFVGVAVSNHTLNKWLVSIQAEIQAQTDLRSGQRHVAQN